MIVMSNSGWEWCTLKQVEILVNASVYIYNNIIPAISTIYILHSDWCVTTLALEYNNYNTKSQKSLRIVLLVNCRYTKNIFNIPSLLIGLQLFVSR